STQLYLSRGREPRSLEAWDWNTGKSISLYQADRGGIGAFSFSPDGGLLATAWGGEVITLFVVKAGRKIGSLPADRDLIRWLGLSISGNLMVSGGQDCCAKLWDVKRHFELATVAGNDYDVTGVAFTPDDRAVVTLSRDGTIKTWDLQAVLFRDVPLRT